jgi:MFS family permease
MSRQKASLFGILIVILGALFYCYEYFLRIAPSVMATDLMHFFSLNATMFGALSGFYYYAYTPMQLFVGVIVDRYKIRNVLVIAILCCALGSLLFASTHSYHLAAAGRFLQGFGSAFAFVGALKLATKWLPVWWFAAFSGICTSLGFLGGAFGDISLTHLMQIMGWQELIHIFVVVGFIFAALVWVCLSLHPKHAREFDEIRKGGDIVTLKGAFLQLWDLIKKPYIWIAGIMGGLMFLPTIVFADLWGIPYLQEFHGYSLTQAGLMTSMIYFGWALGGPLQGILSSLLKKRMRLLFWNALLATLLSCIFLYMSGLSYLGLCIILFIFGMASSAQILTFAMGRDICTVHTTGMAMAFINFLVMISGMFMQSGVGKLLDLSWSGHMANGLRVYTSSDYQHAMVVVPVSLLISAIIALVTKDRELKLVD